MLVASSCMIVTGIILAIVKTPSDERAAKFRIAKHGLTVAVMALGVLNMVQISIDPDADMHYLGSCIALAISFVQAMLFTMVVLVLIRPEEVTLKRVLCQLAFIILLDVLLVASYFLLPLNVFFYVYELCILLYIALLVVYTRWYVRSHRYFVEQISAYYEEEEIERGLHWLDRLFWMALAVGILSMLMLLGNHEIEMWLTLALAVFYAVLAASFINYELRSNIILPALSAECDEEPESPEPTAEHPDKLMKWIEQGGYLDTQMAVKDIAGELQMTIGQFHQYFQEVVGEDFRSWRVRKRIEHAQQMMREHPEWSVTKVAQSSGFNDRSWFYQQFVRFTGKTVPDYRSEVAGSSKKD